MIEGRVSGFVLLVVTVACMLYGVRKARSRLPQVRKIAGLEAIGEAVGRATEMGKAVFCTPGWSDITTGTAGATFAAIDTTPFSPPTSQHSATRAAACRLTEGHSQNSLLSTRTCPGTEEGSRQPDVEGRSPILLFVEGLLTMGGSEQPSFFEKGIFDYSRTGSY